MRLLIAEAVALKPHLETAGEFALCAHNEGDTIGFVWLGDNLPWSDWHLPRIARWLGCSLARRVKKFATLLKKEQIETIVLQSLDAAAIDRAATWAKAFTGSLVELKAYRYQGATLGTGVASSLISWTHDNHYDPIYDLSRVRACLLSAALVYERTCEAITQFKPDRILTFNGRFALCKPIVAAAEKHGVQLLRHERGATLDRYEIFTEPVHDFSYIHRRILELWESVDVEKRERLGHEYFQRRRKGDGVGWHSFIDGQKTGHTIARQDAKRRVVYYSSSDDEFAAIAEEHAPAPWVKQMEAANDLIRACAAWPDIELVIRIHPHLMHKAASQRNAWEALEAKGICIIRAEDTVDSYALMESADIAVSYGSKMGIEAAYWGKPTILMGPCSYAGMDANYEPQNIAELKALLSPAQSLESKSQQRCLAFGHYMLTFGTPFKHYQPSSLSEGTFLGERLGWDPDWIYWLRKQGVGKILRKLMKRK